MIENKYRGTDYYDGLYGASVEIVGGRTRRGIDYFGGGSQGPPKYSVHPRCSLLTGLTVAPTILVVDHQNSRCLLG